MDLRTSPRWLRPVLLVFILGACGDRRAAQERVQLARFPKGEIFQDGERPGGPGRALPDCLRLLAPVLGRGVCIPLDVVRPDGARDAPRWGRWTYEYVATTQTTSTDGKPLTRFTDIEDSSLGLEAQGEYESGEFVGEWTFWHPNGHHRAKGSFADGKMSGEWSFWLADGSPDGALDGVYQSGVRLSAKQR